MPLNRRQTNYAMRAVNETQRKKEPRQFTQQRRRNTARLYRSPLEQRTSLRKRFQSLTLTYVETVPQVQSDFIGNWLWSIANEENDSEQTAIA